MHLKAKRLVRTPYSEQYALFDLDRTDENFDPVSIGKLDIHYTQHGIYGTLLFWQDVCKHLSWDKVLREAELLMAEFQTPMGVPGEYAIEFFSPALKQYELLSNIEPEEEIESTESNNTETSPVDIENAENESENYRSIWPFRTSQNILEERDEDSEDEIYDTDVEDVADDEEENALSPSKHSGIHSQLRWTED